MSSSVQLNEEEIELISLIMDIINAQDWKALEYAMIDNPYVFQSFARAISKSSEINGLTFLHACVRFDPPPYIVEMLLELVPESPSCVDCFRRTPLHVAAGTGASFPIIKLLSEAFPEACIIQDDDGMIPLHMACDNACQLFEGDGDSPRDPPSYDVIAMLVHASPLAVLVEDLNAMSALEYAILSDAPIQVINLLQKATQLQCEARQEMTGTIKKTTPRLASPSISTSEHESSAVTVVSLGFDCTPTRQEDKSSVASV